MNIIKNPNNDELETIVSDLRKGELIVYPTDTIYGIAANINNENAIKKVYKTKQRSMSKPLSVCVHNIQQIKQLAFVNKSIEKILNTLLPGPYTLILEKKENTSSLLTSEKKSIGIRIPDNEICHYLTKGFPITSTSANISNNKTPNNINEIANQLGDNITTYIDCGEITNNQPSTIIDLTTEYPKILRKGQCQNKILDHILKINLY